MFCYCSSECGVYLCAGNRLKLNTSSSDQDYEYLHCTTSRCSRRNCNFNIFLNQVICSDEHDFIVHLAEPRKNKKIKNNDLVALQSYHKRSYWVECIGQNICSISLCHDNDGSINTTTDVSMCEELHFQVISIAGIRLVKDGHRVNFKHRSNDTYLYCTAKWCKMLPECEEGEGSDSEDMTVVTCHSPTVFSIDKFYD